MTNQRAIIQATIDDTVSWVELTDKYEIIKSEGRIITMIEKEQKNDTDTEDSPIPE